MIGFMKRLHLMKEVNMVVLDTAIGLCTTSQLLELAVAVGLIKVGYSDPIISTGTLKNIRDIEKSIFISRESILDKGKGELFSEVLMDLSSKRKISTKTVDTIRHVFIPNLYSCYQGIILKHFYGISMKQSYSVWTDIYRSIDTAKNILVSLCQYGVLSGDLPDTTVVSYNDVYEIKHPMDCYPDSTKYIAYGEWSAKDRTKNMIIHRTYDRDGIPRIQIPPEFFTNTKFIEGIVSVDTERQDFIVVEEDHFIEIKRYLEIRCGSEV